MLLAISNFWGKVEEMMMKYSLKCFSTASVLAVLSAQGAFAVVTPEDVWANWQAQAIATGSTLTTTSQSRQGASLISNDVVMEMVAPEGMSRVTYGKVELRDLGDGTVSVHMDNSITMTMALPENMQGEGEMTFDTLKMVVSGTPEAMTHVLSAKEATISLSTIRSDDDTSDEGVDFDLTFIGLAGDISTEGRQITASRFNLTSERAAIDIETGGETGAVLEGQIENLVMNGSVAGMAAMALMNDPAKAGEALKAGLAMQALFTTGKSAMAMTVDDENGETNVTAASEASSLDFSMGQEGMRYALNAVGLAMSMSGDTIPLPKVDVAMASADFGLTMPLVASEEPQNFGLLTRFVDLVLPDDLWSMLDPMQNLPRDPATLIIDLAGKARIIGDIFKPTDDMAESPGELNALDIKAVQLKLAGADLTGKGSFTFDNSDLETFGGIPRPTGAVDMKLVGGNALLDKAIAMGLIPQDEAMGYRMMMALFARPGEGEDTLVSKIEVTEDGAVLANGQRIQ